MPRAPATALAIALIAPLASALAEAPVPGEALPVYSAPGAFRVDETGAGLALTVMNSGGDPVGRYDLAGCGYRAGRDGVFALVMPGGEEPMVAAVCTPEPGGGRIAIFAPARDPDKPILDLGGETFLDYAIQPGRIAIRRDAGGETISELWHPGFGPDSASEIWTRRMVKAAEGQTVPEPPQESDPDFQRLAGELHRISAEKDAAALLALAGPEVLLSFGGAGGEDTLRLYLAEPWFWPEFARSVEGGGVLVHEWEPGRTAVFPAAFQLWPGDLDPYEFVYGDRPGAVLRAGPSARAPVLADLYRRIVARGPDLASEPALYEDGWVYLCTAEAGCGFASEEYVRSPISWRLVLTQTALGGPWVLESFVAGD